MSVTILKTYYSVRNADTRDVSAATRIVEDSEPLFGASGSIMPLGLNYKILEFEGTPTFQGTYDNSSVSSTTWYDRMSFKEVELNFKNPIYYDISADDPFKLSMQLLEGGESNMKLIRTIIHVATIGPFFQGGPIWTPAQKTAFNAYGARLLHFTDLGNIGAIYAILLGDKELLQTGTKNTLVAWNLANGVTRNGSGNLEFVGAYGNTHEMSMPMLNVIDKALWESIIYKRKFPDGTV